MASAVNNLSKSELKIELEDEVDREYRLFKQFDIVKGHSDHYYAKAEARKPTKAWTTWVQREWRILQSGLPKNIYIRTYEDRMDIMRVAIVGSAETPYHHGLFFFDIFFPPDYPDRPPAVYYWSRGLRLNPNLYECGRVCLSLLNTWYGNGCEKWIPKQSTILQLVVSIQSIVLNSKPYFNEPVLTWPHPFSSFLSRQYSESSFILSCQSMLYTLKRPPMHFKGFVVGHFRKHGHGILQECIAYMNGAKVGTEVSGGCLKGNVAEGGGSWPSAFKSSLRKLSDNLVTGFGIECADCAESLALLDVNPGFFSWSRSRFNKFLFGLVIISASFVVVSFVLVAL